MVNFMSKEYVLTCWPVLYKKSISKLKAYLNIRTASCFDLVWPH